MVQAITPDLTALLKAKLQVGGSGFRGELEIDWVQAQTDASIVQKVSVLNDGAGNVRTTLAAAVTAGNLLVVLAGKNGSFVPLGASDVRLHGTVTGRAFTHFAGSPLIDSDSSWVTLGYRVATGDERDLDWGAAYSMVTLFEIAGADNPATFEVLTGTGSSGTKTIGSFTTPGTLQVMGIVWSSGSGGGGVDLDQTVGAGWTQDFQSGRPDPFGHHYDPGFISAHATSGPTARISGSSHHWSGIAVGITSVAIPAQTLRLPVASLGTDRSRKMVAAQLDAVISNEASDRGWYTQSSPIIAPNNPVRAFAWYGDRANRVRVFTGLLDRVHESRDPKTVSLKARSRAKWLLEQKFIAVGSQDPTKTGAIRTEANGVYVGKTPEYIVGDILTRAGWPAADRVLASTGLTVDEYDLADGTSWAEQIAGSDRLTTIAGADFWEDELGVVHFEVNDLADVSEPAADYAFAAGVDVLKLDHEVDDEDRATRVIVSGPMTSAVPTWKQTWGTTAFKHPVGAWYVATAAAYIYVIDAVTQYLYKVRQSDRKIVAKWYLAGSLSYYPAGLSGDPLDASIFWVLDADWVHGGTTHAKVHKFNASTKAHLASYSLPDGQWSDLKSDGTNLWLTNFGDDKLYKRTLTATAVASYSYAGHTNPTGMWLDGTTIGLFFNNGTTFYKVSTSAPATITGTQSTKGTHILGGEIDTTTHTDLYATNELGDFGAGAGHLWKFALATLVTTTVTKVAADQDLEDDLGEQSAIANRIHDLHSGDPAHPFEIRPAYYAMKLVQSEQQAADVAAARLVVLERLRRIMDLATLGNPAIQINDVIRYTDLVANIDAVWLLDSYRASLSGEGTYTTAMSVLPWVAP